LEEKRQHFRIIKLLVEAGADPKATVKAGGDVSKPKESALEIIITAFNKDFPDEVSNLAEQLMKRPADFGTDDLVLEKPLRNDTADFDVKSSNMEGKARSHTVDPSASRGHVEVSFALNQSCRGKKFTTWLKKMGRKSK
jgi:hypothetical protein